MAFIKGATSKGLDAFSKKARLKREWLGVIQNLVLKQRTYSVLKW